MLYESTNSDPMLMTIQELETLASASTGERRAYLRGILFARMSLRAAGFPA